MPSCVLCTYPQSPMMGFCTLFFMSCNVMRTTWFPLSSINHTFVIHNLVFPYAWRHVVLLLFPHQTFALCPHSHYEAVKIFTQDYPNLWCFGELWRVVDHMSMKFNYHTSNMTTMNQISMAVLPSSYIPLMLCHFFRPQIFAPNCNI